MDKLITELQRLYFDKGQQWPGQEPLMLELLSPAATARTMVIHFTRSTDWETVNTLFQALQNDLDLPAPALSVSGEQGYGLWLSLAQALPLAEIERFLTALRLKYLTDIPLAHLRLQPTADFPAITPLVPALQAENGRWSAYIDPSLGGMFIGEPWLEMAPNRDKQADILAGLTSMTAAEFQQAVNSLEVPPETTPRTESQPQAPAPNTAASLPQHHSGTDYSDPTSFLLAVMNDPSAHVRHRIQAAKALLPYFAKTD